MILTGDGHQAMIDQPLEALGLKRRVALRIPFFVPALFAVTETDLVLTVPRTLATITAGLAKLRKVEPPREIRTFPYFMSWHSRLMKEASHAWLREQIRVAAREVSAGNKKAPLRSALSI
jgi:DNA-binding transcriptional LysR family regulator